MKISFRPFWSFRVESTEQWIQKMSEEGYELISIFTLLINTEMRISNIMLKTESNYMNVCSFI